VRNLALAIAVLLAGCAAGPGARTAAETCGPEVDRLNALLAAESAERQRVMRVATRREDSLRRQLDALKAIERGIVEREDRARSDSR
jgi:hypothetical protein